jgi:hypothetical protein
MKKSKTKQKVSPNSGNELVSLEQAKSLKRHGFRWCTTRYYQLPSGELRKGNGDNNRPEAAHKHGRITTPDGERVAAPTIRTAIVYYDEKFNPEYPSIYLNEAVAASTWRLDYLQLKYSGKATETKTASGGSQPEK